MKLNNNIKTACFIIIWQRVHWKKELNYAKLRKNNVKYIQKLLLGSRLIILMKLNYIVYYQYNLFHISLVKCTLENCIEYETGKTTQKLMHNTFSTNYLLLRDETEADCEVGHPTQGQPQAVLQGELHTQEQPSQANS